MVGISKLYCGTIEPSDGMRYRRAAPEQPARGSSPSDDMKPVVVWNCTRRCNLGCAHCYAASTQQPQADELTTDEAQRLIDDLAAFGVTVLLFSGGEPLLREDIFELIEYARRSGIRAVLSTNGTLLTRRTAERLAKVGLNYCGVSLDGPADINDAFRGSPGAFAKALEGIRNCRNLGLKVGLRLTMHRGNVEAIPAMFDLIARERIPRVCFYHLVEVGRGRGLHGEFLGHEQTRTALDTIIDRTVGLHARGTKVEVLTVDNHADGPYVYLRLLREEPRRAERCLQLLRMNGGNRSGIAIGCVGWTGEVHPDPFWRSRTLGNVRNRPFSEIWSDPNEPLLARLRARRPYLPERCRGCRWLEVCNGNFRARAEAATGDPWGEDPACYLTEEEIR